MTLHANNAMPTVIERTGMKNKCLKAGFQADR
jgi:hypothetical protein